MQTSNELRQITDHLANLVVSGPDASRNEKLVRMLDMFFERRRLHSSNREIALSLIHARVLRQVNVGPPMKLYLWQGSCPDSYYERKDGLFGAISKAVELRPDQVELFMKRRPQISLLRLHLMDLVKVLVVYLPALT